MKNKMKMLASILMFALIPVLIAALAACTGEVADDMEKVDMESMESEVVGAAGYIDDIYVTEEAAADILGRWRAVDFVANIEDFNFDNIQWHRLNSYHWRSIEFFGGGTAAANFGGVRDDSLVWTDNHVSVTPRRGEPVTHGYTVKTIDGAEYIFIEWHVAGETEPRYFVFARADTITFTLSMADDVWDSANMTYGRFGSKDEFIADVEYYIQAISEFISRENWFDNSDRCESIYHIELLLTDGVSRVRKRNEYHFDVYLRKPFFEHGLAPTAHEIAHVIVPWENRSQSLSEGLASYLQDKFGKNPTVFNWGINPHTLINFFMNNIPESFEQIFPVIGTKDARQRIYADGELRQWFYNMSNSFVTYLIETFGIASFMNLYEADNVIDAYYIYFGKSFEDIKSEWLAFLESYPEVMTFEEMSDYWRELFARHNFPMR